MVGSVWNGSSFYVFISFIVLIFLSNTIVALCAILSWVSVVAPMFWFKYHYICTKCKYYAYPVTPKATFSMSMPTHCWQEWRVTFACHSVTLNLILSTKPYCTCITWHLFSGISQHSWLAVFSLIICIVIICDLTFFFS
jgi:hypothetical protein